jgi:hypothetical protein
MLSAPFVFRHETRHILAESLGSQYQKCEPRFYRSNQDDTLRLSR